MHTTLTMSAVLEFHILGPLQSDLVLTPTRRLLLSTFGHCLPQSAHVILRYQIILQTTQHEDRCRCRDKRDFGHRVPLLMAEERKGSEEGKGMRDNGREGGERVF
jgi:hypothetical protein